MALVASCHAAVHAVRSVRVSDATRGTELGRRARRAESSPPLLVAAEFARRNRPSRLDFHAVLGGVNALRCAPTVRSARPAGVDPACAPLEFGSCAMGLQKSG